MVELQVLIGETALESASFLEPGFLWGFSRKGAVAPLGCVVCFHKGLLPGVHPSGVSCWYPENNLAGLVGEGRLSNHLNPFHSLHQLCLLKHLQLDVTGLECFLEKRISVRKMRDKVFKDGWENCYFVLIKGCEQTEE